MADVIADPSKPLRIGQTIKVEVREINPEKQYISVAFLRFVEGISENTYSTATAKIPLQIRQARVIPKEVRRSAKRQFEKSSRWTIVSEPIPPGDSCGCCERTSRSAKSPQHSPRPKCPQF